MFNSRELSLKHMCQEGEREKGEGREKEKEGESAGGIDVCVYQ